MSSIGGGEMVSKLRDTVKALPDFLCFVQLLKSVGIHNIYLMCSSPAFCDIA
jgi:hypothetical protein